MRVGKCLVDEKNKVLKEDPGGQGFSVRVGERHTRFQNSSHNPSELRVNYGGGFSRQSRG